MLCLPRKVTIQLHQILRLPRKMHLMIDPRHIWNIIYNARSNKPHTTTSPNTAPATQNESHDWSASHMKRHLQCAEQAQSASNLTKYCACHEICKFNISAETPWSASANRKTIRADSEDNPRIIRAWNRHLAPAASETLLVPSWRRILYGKIQHFAFRLSPKMSPNAAPATKSDTPISPNTAPATQNESHDWSASHMKRHLHCAGHLFSLGIYSLLASILSRHLFSLGIYSLSASILSRHLLSLGIYCPWASLLSRHLFSRHLFLLASLLSWHLFSRHLFSWHLFSLGIYSLSIYSLGIYSLGISSL